MFPKFLQSFNAIASATSRLLADDIQVEILLYMSSETLSSWMRYSMHSINLSFYHFTAHWGNAEPRCTTNCANHKNEGYKAPKPLANFLTSKQNTLHTTQSLQKQYWPVLFITRPSKKMPPNSLTQIQHSSNNGSLLRWQANGSTVGWQKSWDTKKC